MKKMIALVLMVYSAAAFAQKDTPSISYSMPALEIGMKSNTVDVDSTAGTSVSAKQVTGFQVGGSTVFNFAPSFGLKTGLFYSERPFAVESTTLGTTTESKGKITYFEVPAFFMFKFEEYAGFYAGPSLALKLGDESSPGKMSNIKGMVVPITVGAQFKFTPMLGLNIFFETISGELAAGVKNSRAVGANLMIAFD